MAPRARVTAPDPDVSTVDLGPNPSPPTDPAPTPKPRRTRKARGKATEPTVEAVEALHGVVLVAIAGAFTVAAGLNPVLEQFEPNGGEVDGIFKPLERIYLRHNQVPIMSPDTRDLVQSITAGAAYVGRIATGRIGARRTYSRTAGPSGLHAGPPPQGNGHAGPEPAGAGNGGGAEAVMAGLWADSYVPDAGEGSTGETSS